LIQFDRALLEKWLCRYAIERDALWILVVESKYDSTRGGWCSKEVVGLFGAGVWTCIRMGVGRGFGR
jgi:hypothetical protein